MSIVKFSPDGQYLAYADRKSGVGYFDVRSTKQLCFISTSPSEVCAGAWLPSSATLPGSPPVLITNAGSDLIALVATVPAPSSEAIRSRAHIQCLTALAMSPNGRYMATGAKDSLVGLWNTQELVCLYTLGRNLNPVSCLTFTFDSQYFTYSAGGSADDIQKNPDEVQNVCTVHVESGTQVHQFDTRFRDSIYTLAWHPKHYMLAFATDENRYEIGNLVRVLSN
mmetsp:Transcript_17794/g.29257  ORF Transcript_17794/g.29257 Transcript_17794/m.29257 type:complete len:224 (+) Transcript_17794:283-954(+)|eukprot:CAMPEP_0184654278 /NCGR_PEP_ID=MMETSP0308-20130426/11974_1 /TAXON_ID=38269 /ORGANISM="Gloeochaete witrockiana, Strain SAG 46.84" /LENGTH=223 /DNA_ID=CAMNT_0027090199 /DNA_START=276 /DNA_END=947 /DNA_ORIENTATION=-